MHLFLTKSTREHGTTYATLWLGDGNNSVELSIVDSGAMFVDVEEVRPLESSDEFAEYLLNDWIRRLERGDRALIAHVSKLYREALRDQREGRVLAAAGV